ADSDGIPGDTKALLGGDRPTKRRGYKAHRRSGDVRITPKGGTTCREGSTRSTPAKIASGPCQPPPDVRDWRTKRGRLACASVGARSAEDKFPLSAIKSVQDFGDQRQGHDGYGDDKRRPCSFGQSPQRIADDGNGEVGGERYRVNAGDNRRSRLSDPREKRVRIAFGQELERSLAHLGADED